MRAATIACGYRAWAFARTTECELSRLGHEPVPQRAYPRDVDLDDIAGLQIRRSAVGSHPDHVARPEREILGQLDDEGGDAEDHVVGVEAAGLVAVDADHGLHLVEIDVGLDPWAHWFEGVAILRPPQAAIGLLPAALADIVADGVAEHAIHGVLLGQMFDLLADDDDELAFIVDLVGRGRRDHYVLVMGDQRVLGAIADLGAIGDVRHFAALVGGFLQVLQIIEPDAIKGTRDQRQLDLDVLERVGSRTAPPFAEGIAMNRSDAVAFKDAPGGFARGREFEPTHVMFLTRPQRAAVSSRRPWRAASARDSPARSCRHNPCETDLG